MKMKNATIVNCTRHNKAEETVNVSHHPLLGQHRRRSKEQNQKWKYKEPWVCGAVREKRKQTKHARGK